MSLPTVTSSFPPEWKLIPREQAMLERFAADRIVPHAELDGVIARYRVGPKGRPLKVHLHYLRAKLSPHGIRIASVRKLGFRLAAESRVVLAPYFADAAAPAATRAA